MNKGLKFFGDLIESCAFGFILIAIDYFIGLTAIGIAFIYLILGHLHPEHFKTFYTLSEATVLISIVLVIAIYIMIIQFWVIKPHLDKLKQKAKV